GQSAGVGMAIPASTARRGGDELIRHGRVVRADCGIFSVAEGDGGLLVGRLGADRPAEPPRLPGPEINGGQPGPYNYPTTHRSQADLITAVDGKPVKLFDDLLSYVESKKPGDKVTLTLFREGRKIDVEVELERSKN